MGRARKNALHGRPELVRRIGFRLAAPRFVSLTRAQIVDLYDDGIERACVTRRVRVLVASYFEATPTGVTETAAGTE